ncbi:MAG: hypothetical protein ACQEP6_01695, partial [Patescibacteria group bacterium]
INLWLILNKDTVLLNTKKRGGGKMNNQKILISLIMELSHLFQALAKSEPVIEFLEKLRYEDGLEPARKTSVQVFSENKRERQLELMESVKLEVAQRLGLEEEKNADPKEFIIFLKVNFRCQNCEVVRLRDWLVPFCEITPEMIEGAENFW